MTEREMFEQWAAMSPRCWDIERFPEGNGLMTGQYMDPEAALCWEAWQAATITADVYKALNEEAQ